MYKLTLRRWTIADSQLLKREKARLFIGCPRSDIKQDFLWYACRVQRKESNQFFIPYSARQHGQNVQYNASSIGFTSSIIAVLLALRDGLRLADHMGIRRLEVELDTKVIVDHMGLLNSKKNPNSAYARFPAL